MLPHRAHPPSHYFRSKCLIPLYSWRILGTFLPLPEPSHPVSLHPSPREGKREKTQYAPLEENDSLINYFFFGRKTLPGLHLSDAT